MKILVIDNYDSFTYNLVQYVGALGAEPVVLRNSAGFEKVKSVRPQKIIISPGPGRPENAGVSVEVVKKLSGKIPILGICLGHQVIGYAFGARITYAKKLMHGKVSKIEHDGKGIFRGVKNPISATRYHSLVVTDVPACLKVTASCGGEVMGVRHRKYAVEGVQFHPESILTESGLKMVENFLEM
jgi:anthranilate synthase/aminodeoxychorismate synthase-like glutamine amidotransferase